MKWFNKVENKFGKYAIKNLMRYIIILYAVGFILTMFNPYFYEQYLSLDVSMILRGQVWRLFTFIITSQKNNVFITLITLYLYYILGQTLERVWGAFKFNVYYFMGMFLQIIAAFLCYFVLRINVHMDAFYLNLAIFFAFALTFPDMEFLLMFIIPIKAKYLALFDAALYAYMFVTGNIALRISIAVSCVHLLLFLLITGVKQGIRPKQIKRKIQFQSKVSSYNRGTKHKCAVCGRTEADDENLVFRYCSKCQGDYEYCQEHLYTHKHVIRVPEK